jgi:O-methyltransferase involved in polyketide biosynthesis
MKTDQRSRTTDLAAAVRAVHLRYDHPAVFEDPLANHVTSWRCPRRSAGSAMSRIENCEPRDIEQGG